MELANVLVAIGGDKEMTVPKSRITVAEVEILRAIHGDDAVFDIEIVGTDDELNPRREVGRLLEKYTARDEDGASIAATVYPGRAPVVQTKFEELGLDEDQFKATERATPKAKPAAKKPAAKKTAEKSGEQGSDNILS